MTNYAFCNCGCDGFNVRIKGSRFWAKNTLGGGTDPGTLLYTGHDGAGEFLGKKPGFKEAIKAAEEHAAGRAS